MRSGPRHKTSRSANPEPNNEQVERGAYPQKYWWVILVLLPITLALIKFLPDPSSKKPSVQPPLDKSVTVKGNSNILNSDLSTKTYVITLPAIEKEYAALKHEPLKDEELKKQIEAA